MHACVEKCKAIENFPMLSGAFGSLAMVAVNIIANLITSDYGRTGPLESLHRADYSQLSSQAQNHSYMYFTNTAPWLYSTIKHIG